MLGLPPEGVEAAFAAALDAALVNPWGQAADTKANDNVATRIDNRSLAFII